MTPEDPSVAAIEELLTTAARSAGEVPTRDGKAVVDRAVWFCACITDFDADAPTWLIYDITDGGLGWCRVPDGSDVSDCVDAQLVVGDHVHPEQVLHWLQGADAALWGDHGGADLAVFAEMGRRIRDLQTG